MALRIRVTSVIAGLESAPIAGLGGPATQLPVYRARWPAGTAVRGMRPPRVQERARERVRGVGIGEVAFAWKSRLLVGFGQTEVFRKETAMSKDARNEDLDLRLEEKEKLDELVALLAARAVDRRTAAARAVWHRSNLSRCAALAPLTHVRQGPPNSVGFSRLSVCHQFQLVGGPCDLPSPSRL
jgi:hypothetical protein